MELRSKIVTDVIISDNDSAHGQPSELKNISIDQVLVIKKKKTFS